MKTWIAGGIIVLGLVTLGIFALLKNDDVYDQYGLHGLDVEEMVAQLDAQTLDPERISAGILETELVITTEDEGTVRYPVKEGQFYISIAPYIDNTHPCHNHNLVTCRSELAGETIEVVVRTLDGDVVIDETVQLYDNGFKGFWIPADQEYNIAVYYDGLSVETTIETFEDSGTCITEPLQLS